MRKTIVGLAFAEMILCASAALEENRQQLNELNVFPVPDGDTGTNMSLTMSAAAGIPVRQVDVFVDSMILD